MLLARLAAAIVVAVGLGACGATSLQSEQESSPSVQTTPSPTPTTAAPSPKPTPTVKAELPRGGRLIEPRYRLVGYAGREGAEALGRLGIGDIDERAGELEERAQAYAGDREILPVFELIATVATSFPGPDGRYRVRADDKLIGSYLEAARRHHALLLLNIQPGRADFLPEVKAYEKWLREPDVGLALDPEWAVGDGQVPGHVYGRTSGRELDSVASYLADMVRRYDLPQKVLVFHQVHQSIVRDQGELRDHRELVIVKSVDGIGSRGAKEATWRRLTADMPDHFHSGFKLFYVEDKRHGPLMTPEQVLDLRPEPIYVMYE